MMRLNIFNLIFICTLLNYTFNSNAELQSQTNAITHNQNTDATSELQQNNNALAPHISELSPKNTDVPNAPELFAKVLELEEQLRELNGQLQNSERSFASLSKKVDDLYEKVAQMAADKSKPKSNLSSKKTKGNDLNSNFSHSINLIESGKSEEAIKLLLSTLQKEKNNNKQLKNEGAIYYWLAKAYMNTKAPDKAAHYFAKSYRYYSNVKPKNVLVELIDTLASNKKYKQICPLIRKLDVKYLKSLDKNKRTALQVLKTTHCSKN
jgi:TolA-binding protein